jgi:hypothetical protein
LSLITSNDFMTRILFEASNLQSNRGESSGIFHLFDFLTIENCKVGESVAHLAQRSQKVAVRRETLKTLEYFFAPYCTQKAEIASRYTAK